MVAWYPMVTVPKTKKTKIAKPTCQDFTLLDPTITNNGVSVPKNVK